MTAQVHHLPHTVGDTLGKASASDAVVVVYRDPTTGGWRVGWSKMNLEELCLAAKLLEVTTVETVQGYYKEG